MESQPIYSRIKLMYVSLSLGFGFFITIVALNTVGFLGNFVGILTLPGLLLAGTVGRGIHDPGGYLFIFVGNVLAYAAVCFLVLSAINSRSARRARDTPPSLTGGSLPDPPQRP
jgi:hypothetical protein